MKKQIVFVVLCILTALLLCSCGEEKTCAHQYSEEIIPPTCTEEGCNRHTCALCGDSYTDNQTEKLDHSWQSKIITPTCTEGGYTVYTCTACGESYNSEVESAPLGHIFDAQKIRVRATCAHEGYTGYTCTVCGFVVRETTSPMTNHRYNATEENDGTVTITCSGCNDSYSISPHLDYSAYQKECDDNRSQITRDARAELNDLANWIFKIDKELTPYDVLTDKEAKDMLRPKTQQYTISKADAISDTELFFRALKHGYAPYQYFGGEEAFGKAENEVYEALEAFDELTTEEFKSILIGALSFVRDAHFSVGGTSVGDNKYSRYEYCYCPQYFSKDETGYYIIINDKKWYYDGCENIYVSIEPTLLENGIIAYGLIRFCPMYLSDGTPIAETDEITLRCGDETINKTVKWTLSEAYLNRNNGPDYRFIMENGIAYISLRRSARGEDNATLDKFAADGIKLKKANCIIYDIRSHCGGDDDWYYDWIKNISGRVPEIPSIVTRKRNKLNLGYDGNDILSGNRIANDIPIIVLVDDKCASSGESALNTVKCMKNVIVIGSNSGGYQLGAANCTAYLPKSGLLVKFGGSLRLAYTAEEVDAIGYKPDIWCNPKNALDYAIEMIRAYGIVDDTDINTFWKNNQKAILTH